MLQAFVIRTREFVGGKMPQNIIQQGHKTLAREVSRQCFVTHMIANTD